MFYMAYEVGKLFKPLLPKYLNINWIDMDEVYTEALWINLLRDTLLNNSQNSFVLISLN